LGVSIIVPNVMTSSLATYVTMVTTLDSILHLVICAQSTVKFALTEQIALHVLKDMFFREAPALLLVAPLSLFFVLNVPMAGVSNALLESSSMLMEPALKVQAYYAYLPLVLIIQTARLIYMGALHTLKRR
jgi:hypothetical protein